MSQSERSYEQVQAMIKKHLSNLTWDNICAELNNLDSPFADQELSENECGISYTRDSMENRAWRASLGLMSWTIHNFKEKAKDGHCHNTMGHPHGEREPRKCDIGQEFHTKMYNMCLKSFKDAVNTFDPLPETPSEKENSINTTS